MPTSRVTPSPNLRLDAATLERVCKGRGLWWVGTDLEGILFLDGMHRCRELSELGEGGRCTAMAGTCGVLGGEADEPVDRAPRRGWHRCGCHVAMSISCPVKQHSHPFTVVALFHDSHDTCPAGPQTRVAPSQWFCFTGSLSFPLA